MVILVIIVVLIIYFIGFIYLEDKDLPCEFCGQSKKTCKCAWAKFKEIEKKRDLT